MITKKELESVIDELSEIVAAWNDAAEDDDRGRTNDAIVLTIFDDGSGRIGRKASFTREIYDMHEFDGLDDLVEVLKSKGVEFEREKP